MHIRLGIIRKETDALINSKKFKSIEVKIDFLKYMNTSSYFTHLAHNQKQNRISYAMFMKLGKYKLESVCDWVN